MNEQQCGGESFLCIFLLVYLWPTLVGFSLLHQHFNHLEMKLVRAYGGFDINLRNLVVIVRYFVLLDEAVSYVFQSLVSKLISIKHVDITLQVVKYGRPHHHHHHL